jgi:hypothetical protein
VALSDGAALARSRDRPRAAEPTFRQTD